MTTRFLLFLAVGFLVSACGVQAQVSSPQISALAADSNAQAHNNLSSAEDGKLGRPAIVFFDAEQCHICDDARPVMDDLATKYDGQITIIQMDIDAATSRAARSRYQIEYMPTFILFSENGNMLAQIPGWPGEMGMEKTITHLVNIVE